MSNSKISALTSATTPLAGTETLPIVQSGATVKATIANIQAAPIAAQIADSMLFLNASKVPSTSANATFDGTNLGLGASPGVYGGRLAVGGHVAIATGNSLKLWNTGGTGLATLTSTGTNGLTIAASGNTTLSDGSLVIGTSGKGIDFSATAGTGTSELLNDYEEGTWTPNQGSGLTVVGTFSSSGTYTKIGRLVTVQAQLSGSTSVSVVAAGLMTTNLPFTVSGIAYQMGSITNNAANVTGTALAFTGTAEAYSCTAIAATTSIYFSVSYIV